MVLASDIHILSLILFWDNFRFAMIVHSFPMPLSQSPLLTYNYTKNLKIKKSTVYNYESNFLLYQFSHHFFPFRTLPKTPQCLYLSCSLIPQDWHSEEDWQVDLESCPSAGLCDTFSWLDRGSAFGWIQERVLLPVRQARGHASLQVVLTSNTWSRWCLASLYTVKLLSSFVNDLGEIFCDFENSLFLLKLLTICHSSGDPAYDNYYHGDLMATLSFPHFFHITHWNSSAGRDTWIFILFFEL